MIVYVATVETRYGVIAVAETAEEATRLAGVKALEYLRSAHAVPASQTVAQTIEYFGVNVTEIEVGTAKLDCD